MDNMKTQIIKAKIMRTQMIYNGIVFISILLGFLIGLFIVYHVGVGRKETYYSNGYTGVGQGAYYAHPGSCYSCENQFQESQKWMGQSNKCYDCEMEMSKMYGDDAVFDATKTRCFDC